MSQSAFQFVVALERVDWWDRRGSEVVAGRDMEESCSCFVGASERLRRCFRLRIVGHLMAVVAALLETSWCLATGISSRGKKREATSIIVCCEREMQILPVKAVRKRR